jgi:hypothetical protein
MGSNETTKTPCKSELLGKSEILEKRIVLLLPMSRKRAGEKNGHAQVAIHSSQYLDSQKSSYVDGNG